MSDLEERLNEVERACRSIPARWAGGTAAAVVATPVLWAAIIGGQTLTSGQDGIKRAAANLTTATLYDPNHTDRAAWATATSYASGAVVKSGSNSYICTQAGLSASAPTGTGTGIVDGTCLWNWYGGAPTLPLSPDGLGVAYLWSDGVQQFITVGASLVPQKVMVALDPRSIVPFALCAGEWVRLGNTPIQVGATAAITAYSPTYI
jgi:hypothetical protein